MAAPEIVVGQPAILGAEKDRHAIVDRNRDQLPGQGFRGFDDRALSAQPGRGPDHVAERRQGFIEAVAAPDAVHHRSGGVRGQPPDARFVPDPGIDHGQAFEPHVAHGPGRGADVFRVARPVQHDGGVVTVEAGGHQTWISKALKK